MKIINYFSSSAMQTLRAARISAYGSRTSTYCIIAKPSATTKAAAIASVLRRDDSAIMNFLLSYAGKFDMYVEDECAAYVRYCFADPLDAAIFRSRFEPKSEPFRLAC
jgi:hypothetical protein